ncbi:MAG: RHS repeat-associated core domain-containing protein [Pseudomarimonas sp.]
MLSSQNLSTTASETYRYDANGHRVRTQVGTTKTWQVYSQAGDLMFEKNSSTGKIKKYGYLAGRMVGELDDGKYLALHSDNVGSVRFKTDALSTVVTATEDIRAPYGSVLLGWNYHDGPAYAGHVENASSGLTYMKARYYDPVAMRFLSPDPVDVSTANGGNFNRYWYANNNPYSNIDPDGRDCVSNNDKTTCTIRVTGTRIPQSITFDTPPGIQGTYKSGSITSHDYDIRTPHTKNDVSVQDSMVRNPTPAKENNPASPEGTNNNANPDGARGFLADAGGILPGNDGDSPVKSYSFKNGSDTWIINVTRPGHGLHFGYVLRGSVNGEAISIGEGWALPQALPFLGDYINNVWELGNKWNIDDAR